MFAILKLNIYFCNIDVHGSALPFIIVSLQTGRPNPSRTNSIYA